jgi:hypothetical protein
MTTFHPHLNPLPSRERIIKKGRRKHSPCIVRYRARNDDGDEKKVKNGETPIFIFY